MTHITEDPPMSADIIAFGPRQPAMQSAGTDHAEPENAAQISKVGQVAKAALAGTALGTLKLLRFSSYVVLFALRGPIRGLLGFISGLGFLSLIAVWLFVSKDWDHRNVGLIVSAAGLFGGAGLRILFDKLLYALADEGSPL